MELNKIEIRQRDPSAKYVDSSGMVVLIDGVEITGITDLSFELSVGTIPKLRLEIMAEFNIDTRSLIEKTIHSPAKDPLQIVNAKGEIVGLIQDS